MKPLFRLLRVVCAVSILFFASCAHPPTPGRMCREVPPWGKYSGPIRTEWLPGRKMKLLEEVSFVDGNGTRWLAPKGWEIDGASIPKPLWGLVGGPFDDLYRDASVFHDVACDQRTQPWEEVHCMFYQAMRASGVPEGKAKVMYGAVYGAGPRWDLPSGAAGRMPATADTQAVMPARLRTPGVSTSGTRALKAWIEAKNPSLAEIRARAAALSGTAIR